MPEDLARAEASLAETDPAARDERMRRLVEETELTYEEIGRRCGVAGSTVYRRARALGWRRPAAAALRRGVGAGGPAEPAAEIAEPSPEERRREVIARLWRVAEAQSRALGSVRAGAVSARDLKALVDVLERLDRLQSAPPAAAANPDGEGDGRSLHELRDLFYAHLCRIRAERGLDQPVDEVL